MKQLRLRDYLKAIEEDGELKYVQGASCDLEMSSISEIVSREAKQPTPAVLFDDIPGYPAGYRTLFGLLASPGRLARALGLSENSANVLSLLQEWREKMRRIKPIPPKYVSSAPIQENMLTGDKVDLMKFPSPRFHELDGGRYIGTGHTVIMKDPDTGWVNLGTYRCMLLDSNHFALHIVEGQHGSIILNEKYFARGQVMPVAIAMGIDPALWFTSTFHGVPYGVSEYDYAGGIEGKAIEVIQGEYTGLPLPAHCEIVIEGECRPGELADEGPFGEWHGYYANLGLSTVPEPVVTVKNILYRNEPILTCAQPSVPPNDTTLLLSFVLSSQIWDVLEKAGVPGVGGVWSHEAGCGALFNVVSIQQMYAGHAIRAGLIASQFPRNIGRYTIVVDEDIDPSNLSEVIWAMSTRTDVEHCIQILRQTTSSSQDTTISPEIKRKTKTAPKPLLSSRAVINACRPFDWKGEFYPVAQISHDLRAHILDKWSSMMKEIL